MPDPEMKDVLEVCNMFSMLNFSGTLKELLEVFIRFNISNFSGTHARPESEGFAFVSNPFQQFQLFRHPCQTRK